MAHGISGPRRNKSEGAAQSRGAERKRRFRRKILAHHPFQRGRAGRRAGPPFFVLFFPQTGARAARPPGAGEKLATSPKTFGYAGIIIVYFTIMLKHSKIFTVSRACVSAPAVQSRQGPALRPGGRTGGSPRSGGSGAEAQDPERGVSPGNRAVRPKRTMRRVNLL